MSLWQYFLNPKLVKEPVPPQLELISREILVPLLAVFHLCTEKVHISFYIPFPPRYFHIKHVTLEYMEVLIHRCETGFRYPTYIRSTDRNYPSHDMQVHLFCGEDKFTTQMFDP